MKKTLSLLSISLLTLASCSTFATSMVMPTPPAQDAITWAYNNGITKYDTLADFNAGSPVTREQAAKMIVSRIRSNRNLQIAMPAIMCVFSDENSIDASLLNTAQDACALGLFKGYKGAFMPRNYISMSDLNTVITRAISIMPELATYVIPANNTNGMLLRGQLLDGLFALDGIVAKRAEGEKGEVLAATQLHLDEAKTVWTKNAISSYKLTQTLSCFCGPDYTRPVMYSVLSGTIDMTGARYADLSGGLVASGMSPTLHTVEQAFALIQDAINEKADSITVEYDATLGYPTSISIDRSRMIADEEAYYTFTLTK